MNINLELYRIFYVVAKEGNITKAARELMISQPAVSKAIKNLEEQLGGILFVRTKRGVILTDEGKRFYEYIGQMMELVNNAERQFTNLINLETGCVRVGISQTLTREFLLPYLENFHQLYPNVEIQIDTVNSFESIRKLKNGGLDLVILKLPYQATSDISITECVAFHDCFVVNKDYQKIINKKVKLKELNDYPLLLPAKTSNTRKFMDKFCLENGVVLKSSMELASNTLIVEFAKIGLGVGYVTREYIKGYLDEESLYVVEVEPMMPKRHVGLAISNKNAASFSAKKLIEIILNENANK